MPQDQRLFEGPHCADPVGVVTDELAVAVNDRVHGADALRDGFEGIEQGHDCLLERVRHAEPSDAEGPHARDGAGEVGDLELHVRECEAERAR